MIRKFIRAVACSWVCSRCPPLRSPQPAQTYPNKPIRLIVPFPPGGVADLIARPLAEKMASSLGQPVIVDNRAGATGTVGAAAVANAPADGYTLLLGTTNEIAMSPTLYKSLPYDPTKAFAPIALVAEFPNVLVVGPSVKATSLKELIALAKVVAGQNNVCLVRRGQHESLDRRALRIDCRRQSDSCAVKGGGPALNDLLGGHVDAMFATLPSAVAQSKEAS